MKNGENKMEEDFFILTISYLTKTKLSILPIPNAKLSVGVCVGFGTNKSIKAIYLINSFIVNNKSNFQFSSPLTFMKYFFNKKI
jgi:hypothetical protein